MKICSSCKIQKQFEFFCKDNKSKDKHQSMCKSCKARFAKDSPSINLRNRRVAYEHSTARREYKRKYHHKTKLARNVSRRMRQSLRGVRKSSRWESLVDYTIDELREHLQGLFSEGMSWDNYGLWHIDHVKPLSLFNITSDKCDEFKLCWDLKNLQPLWAKDNQVKSDKEK